MSAPSALRPIRVLVVCTGNSARSILAEAVLRKVGGEAFEVHSAGTEPKGINPLTVRVLAEAGIPADGLRSKSVDEYRGQAFDYVITVCDQARQTCPVFPGDGQRLHWGYDDPAAVEGTEEERLRAFRHVFTALSERVRTFAILAQRRHREAEGAALPAAAPDDRVALLRAVPLFAAMGEGTLHAMASAIEGVTFRDGELLTSEGEPGDTFLVIVRGRARVTRGTHEMATLGPGDFLGEMSLLDGGPRTATVTALGDLEALALRRAEFLALLERSSTVRLGVIEALSRRVRQDAAVGV